MGLKTSRGTDRAGAIRCKARRHRWHLRQSWQRGICNLQNLKDAPESESHSLRQILSFKFNNLQELWHFRCNAVLPPVSRAMRHLAAGDVYWVNLDRVVGSEDSPLSRPWSSRTTLQSIQHEGRRASAHQQRRVPYPGGATVDAKGQARTRARRPDSVHRQESIEGSSRSANGGGSERMHELNE
jgi:hypothetical protein